MGIRTPPNSLQIRPLRLDDEGAVVALWRRCDLVRPWNDPAKDIRRKLKVNPEWFLVGLLDGRIIACVMAGYEGHRGWLNYLAVDPDYQRHGYARELVREAERLLREAGCAKINLQVRSSNRGVIEFYRRLGYAVDDVVSMGKRLEHDGEAAAAKGQSPGNVI
jgi:ribosomal protein S18 acetylase RimI-like enzyme